MIKNTSYVTSYKRKTQQITKCYIDTPIIATTSKVIANAVTYPIESVRLLSLCKENVEVGMLYKGINTYIPYCIASSYITYTIFFNCLNIFSCPTQGITVLLSSLTTSILTSFYKLPYNFYQKNNIVQGKDKNVISMNSLYNKKIYPRAFVFMLSEDVPELFMRFYFNNVILVTLPHIEPIYSSLLLAIITTLLTFPMEFWKTSALCNHKNMVLSIKSVSLLILCNITNLFIFFGLFNVLSSCSFIKI